MFCIVQEYQPLWIEINRFVYIMSNRMDKMSKQIEEDRLKLYKDKGWTGLKKQKNKKVKPYKRPVINTHDGIANELAQTGSLSLLIEHISKNFNKRRRTLQHRASRSKSYVSIFDDGANGATKEGDERNNETIQMKEKRSESFVAIIEEEDAIQNTNDDNQVEITPIEAFA